MKKKFLIYWDYRRTDLLQPFYKLSDSFEWNFVFFRHREEDSSSIDYSRFYWGDYSSPYQLIDSIKPDGVIFSDLSNIYALALNIACKNRSIHTYLLEHGIKLDYDYYLNIENRFKSLSRANEKVNTIKPKRQSLRQLYSLSFYLSALKAKNKGEIIKAIELLYFLFRIGSKKAFTKVKFQLRCPDTYLLFSKQNYPYYKQRDGIMEDRVIYFGNPHQDDYILRLNIPTLNSLSPYYLLLDDGQIEAFGINLEQKNIFISKLNVFAKANGARLIIKLHPFDYALTGFYADENITYVREYDISELIINAKGCFAISTTLMLPLIVAGKVILFRLAESKVQDAIATFGVEFLDYLNFSPKEIDFQNCCLVKDKRPLFIEQFLFKMDGRATQRLKEILEEVYAAI